MDTSGRRYTGCIQGVEVIPDGHKWKRLYLMHRGEVIQQQYSVALALHVTLRKN